MKYFILLGSLFISIDLFAQLDSLKTNEKYWEDQLYINITYNILHKQPKNITPSEFSYGVSAGYIKDIPFNRKGNWAGAIGIGYGYDSFNHGLTITNLEGEAKPSLNFELTDNKIRLHNLEFPIQFRWRGSDAVTYSFWRVYAGVRLSYNFHNRFKYKLNNTHYSYMNIKTYNKFQTGIELSAGYSAFNFYAYYGLTPIYKNALIENKKINTRIVKFGLIFYLL